MCPAHDALKAIDGLLDYVIISIIPHSHGSGLVISGAYSGYTLGSWIYPMQGHRCMRKRLIGPIAMDNGEHNSYSPWTWTSGRI